MIIDAFKAFAAATVLLLAAYGGWRLLEDLTAEPEVHSALAPPEADPAVYIEPQPSEEDELLQRVWMKVNRGELPPPVEIDG